MSVERLNKVAGALLSVIVLSGSSVTLPPTTTMIPGSSLVELKIYDHVPEDALEMVLVGGNGLPVQQLAFVLCDLHAEDAKSIVHGQLAQAMGVATTQHSTGNARMKEYSWHTPEEREIVRAFNLARERSGIRMDDIRRTLIISKKYNIVGDGEYSQANLEIANGADLFGVPSTVLFISRADRSREWVRMFHLGIPMPWKDYTQVRLLTSTEMKFVSRLLQTVGTRTAMHLMTRGLINPYGSVEDMRALREQAAATCRRGV